VDLRTGKALTTEQIFLPSAAGALQKAAPDKLREHVVTGSAYLALTQENLTSG
jgi:hypothetical protein